MSPDLSIKLMSRGLLCDLRLAFDAEQLREPVWQDGGQMPVQRNLERFASLWP